MNPVNNFEPIWHMFRPGDTDPSLLLVYFSQSSKQSKQYAPESSLLFLDEKDFDQTMCGWCEISQTPYTQDA